jgi:hypothetical protein
VVAVYLLIANLLVILPDHNWLLTPTDEVFMIRLPSIIRWPSRRLP